MNKYCLNSSTCSRHQGYEYTSYVALMALGYAETVTRYWMCLYGTTVVCEVVFVGHETTVHMTSKYVFFSDMHSNN